MNVLVTGGAGYVGSVASRLLLERGHRVRVLDVLLHGGRPLLPLYTYDGFEFVRGDVRSDADTAAALEDVDAVVHLAAIVGDPACARDPELARSVNRDASLRLLDLSRARGVERFVYASTCSNYGKVEHSAEYVNEDAVLAPLSVYAETKVDVERRLLGPAGGDRPAATVLRFATVFGLSPRPRFDLTVNEFTAELLLTRRLAVYGEQFWRPYVHVRDAARAIALVLAAPLERVSGRVFNVGSTDENYTKADLVRLITEELGGEVTIEYVRQEDDPRDYRVSFERFRETFGFAPTRTVRDGIREVARAVETGVIPSLDDPSFRN